MERVVKVAGGYHAWGDGPGREIVAFGKTPSEAGVALGAAVARATRLQRLADEQRNPSSAERVQGS